MGCPLQPRERLEEFFRQLRKRAPFTSFDEAWSGLAEILHGVEDEFSGIPRNMDESVEAPSDGRMYPPHTLREQPPAFDGVRSFRQKKHLTFFASNGAIEIVDVKGGQPMLDQPVFEKAGADGRRVADYRRGRT